MFNRSNLLLRSVSILSSIFQTFNLHDPRHKEAFLFPSPKENITFIHVYICVLVINVVKKPKSRQNMDTRIPAHSKREKLVNEKW